MSLDGTMKQLNYVTDRSIVTHVMQRYQYTKLSRLMILQGQVGNDPTRTSI